MRRLIGAAIVPGLGVGRAVLLVRRGRALRTAVAPEQVAAEVARIEWARARSREQLAAIKDRLATGPGAELAALFDAQLLMLDDPLLISRAIALVREERTNADWALQRAFDEVAGLFADVDDAYLRERGGDVADVVGRLRMNLREQGGGLHTLLSQTAGPFVLVADDPPPSVTAQLDWRQVAGLAIDAGSRTSHTAILARSLGIPTVVGLEVGTKIVAPGDLVALDGTAGELLVQPPEETIAQLQAKEARRPLAEDTPSTRVGLATTRDGVIVRLEANLDRHEDAPAARRAGARGVGLYRSESLLLGGALPGLVGPESERAQAEAYQKLVAAFAPGPVTIRTFDLDEAQADALGSSNAATLDVERHRRLGVRGIRLGLARPAMLDTQFRAILRAASAGTVRVLLPFVTTAAEVDAARARLERARDGLAEEGIATPRVLLGAMIEVPAAALTADLLAGHADFLALGTNDLAQYLLAADRTDARVTGLGQPFHPALLRMLKALPRLAARHGLPLSVCGELASDPVLLALLLGFGVRDFSMTPAALPAAARIVEHASRQEIVVAARRASVELSLAPVEEYVTRALSGALTKI
jgi:phosphoenolpyruvate-protein phosphotransferase (PTS system enzyme I)